MNSLTLTTNYYHEHRDEIVNFVAMRIQDKAEAEDIVQDLFLCLLDGHRVITEQTLPCLVYTMARHMVADYYRRRRAVEHYEHYIRRNNGADESMESVFSAREIMERLERGLARVPENCREVYRLHIYDGMKVGEISRQTGEGYKSVEYRLGTARKVVRAYLSKAV